MLRMPQFDHAIEDDDNETETLIIQWQQKFFSARENALYSDSKNCQTDLHKRYHQQCHETDAREMENHHLFTYIADDDFVPNKSSVAANPEHFWGPNDTRNEHCQVMFVMGDLYESAETVLFKMTWNSSERTLKVFPDFNDFDADPYYKEIDLDIRQLYRYSIEHISQPETLLETNSERIEDKKVCVNFDFN